jgi:hypothetical protein
LIVIDFQRLIKQGVPQQSEPSPNPNYPCSGFYWRNGVMIDLNAHLTQPTRLHILVGGDINDSGENAAVAWDPSFNKGDNVSVLLVPVQDEQGAWQNSQSEGPAAAQPAVSLSDLRQRFSPLSARGWRIAR